MSELSQLLLESEYILVITLLLLESEAKSWMRVNNENNPRVYWNITGLYISDYASSFGGYSLPTSIHLFRTVLQKYGL